MKEFHKKFMLELLNVPDRLTDYEKKAFSEIYSRDKTNPKELTPRQKAFLRKVHRRVFLGEGDKRELAPSTVGGFSVLSYSVATYIKIGSMTIPEPISPRLGHDMIQWLQQAYLSGVLKKAIIALSDLDRNQAKGKRSHQSPQPQEGDQATEETESLPYADDSLPYTDEPNPKPQSPEPEPDPF